jgi:leucyl aminopeptidase (aminopeptidase T)
MPNYDKLVRNVLSLTLNVQPDDGVIVETWDHGLPLATEFVYRLRELGARSMLLLESEKTYGRSLAHLPEDKLGKVGEPEWAAMEKAKAYIFIPGPADFQLLWKNKKKFAASTAYNEEWYERAKRYRLKAARIGLGYATAQRAHAFRFPLTTWQNMLLTASSLNFNNLRDRIQEVAPHLRNGEVKLTATNGTDLALRLADRDPYQDDCIVDEDDLNHGRNVANIPGGNILTCPDETYAEGNIVFDYPTAYMGKLVDGIHLTFKNGLMTDFSIRKNPLQFKSSYDRATGEKNKVAVIGVGLNPKARAGFLQNNIVEGAVTVGIGGNDDIGGANKTDFYFAGVLTKPTLTVDSNVIIKNGKLVV